MLNLPEKFVIFDLEWTTWEGAQERHWKGPNEYREVVEIGAILVDGEKLEELDSFDLFVQPKKNPKLSEYFINLTGITQEKVEREGIKFEEAINKFSEWCGSYPLYSFGNGDPEVIEENCALLELPLPFDKARFFNTRNFFKKYGIPADTYTSGTLLKAFGKELVRRAHSGLNDARTILDGLRELAARRVAD